MKIEAFFHLTNNVSYPLLVALAALIFPAMVIRHRLGWTRLVALDFPFFFVSTASVVAFYLTSQREIDPAWRRSLRFMPMLVALGVGLSLNNALAVFGALSGRRSEFERTPKYSIRGAGEAWRDKLYRSRPGSTVLAEAGFAIYFAAAIAESIRQRMFLALPFLLLFFSGFVYMCALTLAERRTIRRPHTAAVRETEPAA